MMFKGTKDIPQQAYNDYLNRLGAGTNGYTTEDYTCYYTVFAGRENLEEVVRTESDRFINLYYDEAMLKTEAPVIEGEYYKSVSNPLLQIEELLLGAAFEKHSYKHTVIGFLQDIQDMPNQFAYSQEFKKRYYSPDNSVLMVAGDFDHNQLMEYVNKCYGAWEKSGYALVTPTEPPQTKAKRAHYDWPTPTLPRLAIAFHGPAYSDENIDLASLDLLSQISFSNRSPLYQKLVIEEQKCLELETDFMDHRDPYLLTFHAIIKNDEDLAYVEEEILKEIERIKNEPVSQDVLADVKSNLKYSFASRLGTTDGVAGRLAHFLSLTADPGTINKLYSLYDNITPQNIQDMAQKYFQKNNSTVVTLTGGKSQ
jgi:zinc protease